MEAQRATVRFGFDLSNIDIPDWGVMWLVAAAIFAMLKGMTWLARGPGRATPARHVAYLFAWPGLDARAFLFGDKADAERDRSSNFKRPAPSDWFFAFAKMLFGLCAILLAGMGLAENSTMFGLNDLALGWLGMTGILFTLHFGLFDLVSCFWRAHGIDAAPLMNWPIASRCVAEFWGRRWNTAFRDVTNRFLFRPLAPKLGAGGALFAAFLVSGLIHESAISFPASACWGMPTLYFLIQSLGIFAERSALGRRFGLSRGWQGRAFAALVIVAPLGLLAPAPFVRNVINPFLLVIEKVL